MSLDEQLPIIDLHVRQQCLKNLLTLISADPASVAVSLSKRKPCNRRVQLERSMRALVNTNHAAVINIDPSGLQVMINWKNGKQILSKPVADALCDVAHR